MTRVLVAILFLPKQVKREAVNYGNTYGICNIKICMGNIDMMYGIS